MKKLQKISTTQLFSLLLLSRLLTTLTFMPIFSVNVKSSDYIPAIFLGSIGLLIFLIPMFILLKNKSTQGILEISNGISPTFFKAISMLYIVFLLVDVFSTISRLNLFVASVMFPETDTTLLMILTIAAVCYTATKGLEALGRAGGVCLIMLVSTFIFIILTMLDKVDLNNLSPVLYDGAKPVLTVAWWVIIRTTEPVLIALMMPCVTGNVKRGAILSTAFFCVFATVLFFVLFTTLVNSALLYMFPIHSMAELSQFSMIERLDSMLAGVWIISAFIKISLITYLVSKMSSDIMRVSKKTAIILTGAVIMLFAIISGSGSVRIFSIATGIMIKSVIFLLFTVIIPTVVLVLYKIKGRQTV